MALDCSLKTFFVIFLAAKLNQKKIPNPLFHGQSDQPSVIKETRTLPGKQGSKYWQFSGINPVP